MIASYRLELRLSFAVRSTYILLSLYLLVFGILCALLNLFFGFSSLSYPLGFSLIPLAILLPFLPFFSDKRERKGNMGALLFSLPLSPAASVLGSFLGQMTLLLIPTALLSLFPFLFSLFGNALISTSQTALLGFFLYTAFLLCVNRMLFCALGKPFLSLAASILVNAAFYVLNILHSYLPLDGIPAIAVSLLNPMGFFSAFTNGKFSVAGTLYFLSLIAALLWCEILLRKKKRGDFSNKKRRLRTLCVLAILLVCLILSNLFFSLLPERIRNIDVTGTDVFRVSNTTLDVLHNLNSPVEIYLLSEGGKNACDKDFLSFVNRYDEESEKLTLTVVDTQKDPSFLSLYTAKKISDQSLIVSGNGRYRILDRKDFYHYENPRLGSFSASDYEYLVQSYLTYMQTGSIEGLTQQSVALGQQLYYATDTIAYFDGDSLLCNAIRFADDTSVPTVYVATESTFTTPDDMLSDVLTENGFFVKDLPSVADIPTDCSVLVLFSPKKDINEAQKSALSSYLSRGGKIFLTTDYSKTELPKLLSILGEYGLGAPSFPNVICESNKNAQIEEDKPYFFLSRISTCPATENDFSGVYASILSHAILVKETEGVNITKWLTTTQKGYLRSPESAEKFEEGTYCCGAIAEKGDSAVIWISSPLSVSSTGFVASEGGNFRLFLSAFRWMCGSSFEKISIESTTIVSAALALTEGELILWTLVIAVLIPMVPISIGIVLVYVRKKR